MEYGLKPGNIANPFWVLIFLLMLTACVPVTPTPFSTTKEPVTPTITYSATLEPSGTPTETLLPSPSSSPTSILTPELSKTFTPSPAPTLTVTPAYVVLRGVVNQGHVNCYYGPSKAYLYKYGLLKGNRLDIIGWQPDTGYLQVKAIGGDNPCWMNMEFMDIAGDIQSVRPVSPEDVKLPQSPYYPALAFAKAERSGNEVTITWSPLKLKAGDDSEQEPYLLETWVCRDGKITFVPVGAYQNQAKVADEPGCGGLSHARVYGVEKHGYTKYLEFDWPQAD